MKLTKTTEELIQEFGLVNPTKQKLEREIKKHHYEVLSITKIVKGSYQYELIQKQDDILKEYIETLVGKKIDVPAVWVAYYINLLTKGDYCLSDTQVAWTAPPNLGKGIKISTKRNYINRIKNALKSLDIITETEEKYFKIVEGFIYLEVNYEDWLEGIKRFKEIEEDELAMLFEDDGFTLVSDVDLGAAGAVACDEVGGYYVKILVKNINQQKLRELLL